MTDRPPSARSRHARPTGSLQHGLAVLDLYTSGDQVLSVGDMARMLGAHKSTVSRTAATLAATGYLEATARPGRYRLGPRIAALGRLVYGEASLEQTAAPHMTVLAASTGETAHLGVLDGGFARTVAVVDGWHTVRMHTWQGRRTPAHCSAMGKAVLAGLPDDEVRAALGDHDLSAPTTHSVSTIQELLAELARTRERGVAFDLEELEPGLCCAAAPIFDERSSAVASVSVSAPQSRVTAATIPLVGEHVAWAAAQITAAGGGRRPSAPWPPAPAAPPQPLPWVDPALSDAHRLGRSRTDAG